VSHSTGRILYWRLANSLLVKSVKLYIFHNKFEWKGKSTPRKLLTVVKYRSYCITIYDLLLMQFCM
jgi:hypothetical protein